MADLHQGMNPDDMTETDAINGVVGHIAGDLFAARKELMGVPPGDPQTKLAELCRREAAAIINEIKNHAKFTVTLDVGAGTADIVIE